MSAAFKLSVNSGLSQFPEFSQQKYPELYLECQRLRNAIQTISYALDRYTGIFGEDKDFWSQSPVTAFLGVQNISRLYAKAEEAIAHGDIVYIYDSAGTLAMKKARANALSTAARGFCSVSGGVLNGEWGELQLLGANAALSGLTKGSLYYLSPTTSGQVTSTKPTTVGQVPQVLGFALSSSVLWFNPELDYSVI